MKNFLRSCVFVSVCLTYQAYGSEQNYSKSSVAVGFLQVSSSVPQKAIFNLTLQERVSPADYPYVLYSNECPDGIELPLSAAEVQNNLDMMFAVLLTAKQNQNYVDVTYVKTTGETTVCTLKAITIKYKQN